MKLYDIPPNNTIIILDEEVRIPPASPEISQGDRLKFHHIDGMYSYCETESGQIVHPAAWTEVKIITENNGKVRHAVSKRVHNVMCNDK